MFCKEHISKIAESRVALGLQKAPLKLEWRGVDPFDDKWEGHNCRGGCCEICELKADLRTESDDGKFLVRVWAGQDEPYCLVDGFNSIIPDRRASVP
jgi:hypothetical protein